MRDWVSTLERSSPADLGWSADHPAPKAARTALYRILRKRAGRQQSRPTPAPTPSVLLGSTDVVREAGITFRQLDYWTRTGRLVPAHARTGRNGSQGFQRWWTQAELDVARLLGRLTAAGLPLETAARIARSDDCRHEIAPGIWIEVVVP